MNHPQSRRQGQPGDLQRDPSEGYSIRHCMYVECVLYVTPGIPLPINLPGGGRYSLPPPPSCPTYHRNTHSSPRHSAEVLYVSFVSLLEVCDRRALGIVMKFKVFLQAPLKLIRLNLTYSCPDTQSTRRSVQVCQNETQTAPTSWC